jgi:hypothetical protein
MSFALAVFKGDRDIFECPHMDRDAAQGIVKDIVKTDWKEELIVSLQEEIRGIDFSSVAAGLGAEMDGDRMKIKCLGTEYSLSPDGQVSSPEHLNPWIKILLLHYIRTGGRSPARGTWISFSELKGGLVKASSFLRECEEPLRQLADRDIGAFTRALGALDGKPLEGESSDHAWIIYPLPKVPFLILYWQRDSEFDSVLKVLFDSTADEYLDVESHIFIGEGLVEAIKRIGFTGFSSRQ